MAKPQFAERRGLLCEECQGRSFSDPTKAYHYPECSRYKEWRFGKKNVVGGRVTTPSESPRAPLPTTSELISDKVMDSVLEDLWREVNGDHPW